MSLSYIKQNLAEVKGRIALAEAEAGRVGKTQMLAAVKYGSAEELAERMGVTVSTVTVSWSRFWRGLTKSTRYAMVFLDEEDEHGEE